jgi:hypothetical protein
LNLCNCAIALQMELPNSVITATVSRTEQSNVMHVHLACSPGQNMTASPAFSRKGCPEVCLWERAADDRSRTSECILSFGFGNQHAPDLTHLQAGAQLSITAFLAIGFGNQHAPDLTHLQAGAQLSITALLAIGFGNQHAPVLTHLQAGAQLSIAAFLAIVLPRSIHAVGSTLGFLRIV